MSCILALRATGRARAITTTCVTHGKSASSPSSRTFEDKDDYYFRFGGHSHHAGEYQNYIEYFARCLAAGETPKPDASEGIVTVALMQAMEESCAKGLPVKIKGVLARYDLADLWKA